MVELITKLETEDWELSADKVLLPCSTRSGMTGSLWMTSTRELQKGRLKARLDAETKGGKKESGRNKAKRAAMVREVRVGSAGHLASGG